MLSAAAKPVLDGWLEVGRPRLDVRPPSVRGQFALLFGAPSEGSPQRLRATRPRREHRGTSGTSRPGALDSLVPLLRSDSRIILAARARPFALRYRVEVLRAVLQAYVQALDLEEAYQPGVGLEEEAVVAALVRYMDETIFDLDVGPDPSKPVRDANPAQPASARSEWADLRACG